MNKYTAVYTLAVRRKANCPSSNPCVDHYSELHGVMRDVLPRPNETAKVVVLYVSYKLLLSMLNSRHRSYKIKRIYKRLV